jgi:pimeloyl-[acyl-carrier protein] methyl ester esterase
MVERLPLVLLHGWGAHARIWDGVAAELGCDRPVSVPDLPGYGESAIDGDYTPDGLARSLSARIDRACVLLGWSMGGLIAQAWATMAPSQIRGLVLVSSTPCFVRRADWPHGMPNEVLASFAAGLGKDGQAALGRFQALQARQDVNGRNVLSTLRHETEVSGVPSLKTLSLGLDLLREADLRDAVSGITCQTLVVHGGRDTICAPDAGRWLAEALPIGRLAVHAGAAHAPFLSDAPWFLDQIWQFLREIDVA